MAIDDANEFVSTLFGVDLQYKARSPSSNYSCDGSSNADLTTNDSMRVINLSEYFPGLFC